MRAFPFLLLLVLIAGCPSNEPGSCGDGLCRPAEAESCSSCPIDCMSTCAGDAGMGARCGDFVCSPAESCATCPADCGPCAGCGDGACNGGETCTSCAFDCGGCPPRCGDGACDGPSGETCGACPSDCGACPTCFPSCAPGFNCEGTTCVLDPASRWTLVIDGGTTAPLPCGGSPGWDSTFSSTPCEGDPIVYVWVGDSTATPTRTASTVDTCSIRPGTVAVDVRADELQAYLYFRVEDEDVTSNDSLGGCFVPVPASAFEGFTQTITCPANCTTATDAGWGPIQWHLER
jgi:hypothetical protein